MVVFLYLVWFSLFSSLFWELRDDGVMKNFQFCPLESCEDFNIQNVVFFIKLFLFCYLRITQLEGTSVGPPE